jgi:protocatechuate 3,4-dioxygenase beta subunit
MKYIFLSCITLSAMLAAQVGSAVYAAPQPEPLAADRYAVKCAPTPAHGRTKYPGADAIHSSGSLARPAGKAEYASGQILYVHGRVFDSACVPLKNAKVELWQADAEGKVRYARTEQISNPYPLFAGSGRVTTDNEGAFMFETIVPAAIPVPPKARKQTKYLNLRISHPVLKTPLITTIYFEGEPLNSEDVVYNKLSDASRTQLTKKLVPYKGDKKEGRELKAGLLIHHDITVQGRDYFRKF